MGAGSPVAGGVLGSSWRFGGCRRGDRKTVSMEWVLDWDRIANLFVVLTPFFVAIGAGCKHLLDRAERREAARRDAEDERRAAERKEMKEEREGLYDAVRAEAERSAANAQRMRELYEAELDRAITLRLALAEAARREAHLQETIINLNAKVDRLQSEISALRRELDDASHPRSET